MNWTTPADLKKQLERLWKKGTFPNALFTQTCLFPLTLTLRTPSASEITHRLHAVRDWTETLKAMRHITHVWHTVNNRVQGTQTLPHKVVIETLENALALLGKHDTARQIMKLHAMTGEKAPFLLSWLSQNARTAHRHATEWERLLTLAVWMRQNPAPGIYLRQVDLPGVHTKFIEQNRTILSQIFQQALPSHAVNTSCSGMDQFESHYGFRIKPLRIRFRILDATLPPFPASAHPDITLDSESFAAFSLKGSRIFIVENESCFLAFPYLENAVVIFGAGYCWDVLKPALWLQKCSIYYWGDIDTHGFRILDHLRAILPQTYSFLMDEPTLLAYNAFWDREPSPVRNPLSRLTPAEQSVFTALQTDLFGQSLRLEQERIHFSDLYKALNSVVSLNAFRDA